MFASSHHGPNANPQQQLCHIICVTNVVAPPHSGMAVSQTPSHNGIDHSDSNNANDANNAIDMDVTDEDEHSDCSEDDQLNW